MKTFLGKTGAFDMDGALDVILGHPSTAKFVTAKLYRELVGLDSRRRDGRAARARAFRRDYEIMPLVEAIVHEKAFTSDDAVRAKYRTPVEKLVGIMQATGTDDGERSGRCARRRDAEPGGEVVDDRAAHDELPPVPPAERRRVPEGRAALGPGNLVHSFDLLQVVTAPPTKRQSVDDVFASLGVFDVSDRSRRVLGNAARTRRRRFSLAVTSPEFTLT